MGQYRPLFWFIFVFSNQHQHNFYNKVTWKNVHPVYGAGIRTHNLSAHESPPITTRPRLLPQILHLFAQRHVPNLMKPLNHSFSQQTFSQSALVTLSANRNFSETWILGTVASTAARLFGQRRLLVCWVNYLLFTVFCWRKTTLMNYLPTTTTTPCPFRGTALPLILHEIELIITSSFVAFNDENCRY